MLLRKESTKRGKKTKTKFGFSRRKSVLGRGLMNKSTLKKEENGKILQSSVGQSYKTQTLISKQKSYCDICLI